MRKSASHYNCQPCPSTTVMEELPPAKAEMRPSMMPTFSNSTWPSLPRSIISWRDQGFGSVDHANTPECGKKMNDFSSTRGTEVREKYPQNNTLLPLPSFHGISPRNIYMIEFSITNRRLGRVLIETNPHLMPVATANFATLCTGKNHVGPRISYEGCDVFRILRGRYIYSGDNTKNDGTGGMSIVYHHPFFRENSMLNIERGSVGMVYEVVNLLDCSRPLLTSRFKIFLADEPDADVSVFGRVVSGLDVVERISALESDKGKPKEPVFISSCGKLDYL